MPRCKNHSSVYRARGFPQARSGAAVELSMLPGEAYKVYVSVFVEHRSDGTIQPRLQKPAGKAIVTPSKSMVQEHISILNDPPI